MKKTVLSLVVVGALIASCEPTDNKIKAVDGKVVSTVSSSNKTDKQLDTELKEFEAEESIRIAEMESTLASLEFDEILHDFGNVGPDSENTTEFVITNTGNMPLIIQDVTASCGCTTPQKPEKPIPPGKTDVIKVTFKPKEGQKNEIRKTVTVTANTPQKVHKIEIRAFVL
ncbi:MAG: hypothetical protein ACI865_000915 [Flavobacteriaceae bacterium]|jgi:hypothetical protein